MNNYLQKLVKSNFGGALSIIIIIVGNEIGDLSSNTEQGCLCFIFN